MTENKKWWKKLIVFLSIIAFAGCATVDPQTGEMLDPAQTFNIFRPQLSVTEQNIAQLLVDDFLAKATCAANH